MEQWKDYKKIYDNIRNAYENGDLTTYEYMKLSMDFETNHELTFRLMKIEDSLNEHNKILRYIKELISYD